MTLFKRCAAALALLGVLAAALYVTRDRTLPGLARWLDVGCPPEPSDYAVVLAGDENTRPFVAAALLNAGLARKVLVFTTSSSPGQEDGIMLPTHEISRQVFLHLGIPDEDIVVLDKRIVNTYYEAEALAEFLAASPGARVCVVTNDYHTRRARWIFAKVLGDRAGQVQFVSAPTDDFHAGNWWQVEVGFVTIVSEYLRLLFYLLRYSWSCRWIAAGAVIAVIALAWRRRRGRAA